MDLFISIIGVLWYASTFALLGGALFGVLYALVTGVMRGLWVEENRNG